MVYEKSDKGRIPYDMFDDLEEEDVIDNVKDFEETENNGKQKCAKYAKK